MRHAPEGDDPEAEAEALESLIADFANAVKAKLRSQIGKRSGWADPAWSVADIRDRIDLATLKGDPVDIAAFAAFLWNRSEP